MSVRIENGAPPAALGAATEPDAMYRVLARVDQPCYVVATDRGIGLRMTPPQPGERLITAVGPLPAERLGASEFRARHGLRYAYVSGAMAAGIASEDLVIALSKSGFLGSFGAGGLLPQRVERALQRFAAEIPALPYMVNVLHAPNEQALERDLLALCLRERVRCVEASAYMDLTPHLVRYRVAGLRYIAGQVEATNRIVAKISRPEVAEKFLLPPPEPLVAELLAVGLITDEQARLARLVSMADDITVESDSGGHTDRRPLSALFPTIVRQRDNLHRQHPGLPVVRIGAAGGIGTPAAVAAAFALGADYVLTGSVNQTCVEAATSEQTRQMLAVAGVADYDMAPSADMFEYGAQVQVLKKGTMFPVRARRLHHLYQTYDGLESLPAGERDWLERQVLRRSVEEVWADVVSFFERRDPDQIRRAANEPKRRMALVFRWYLGLSSRWAVTGNPERKMDYQVWCGPALGSFNDWVKGSYLAAPENRSVVDVAHHLLHGAAFVARAHQLQLAGVRLPLECTDYRPVPLPRENGLGSVQ